LAIEIVSKDLLMQEALGRIKSLGAENKMEKVWVCCCPYNNFSDWPYGKKMIAAGVIIYLEARTEEGKMKKKSIPLVSFSKDEVARFCSKKGKIVEKRELIFATAINCALIYIAASVTKFLASNGVSVSYLNYLDGEGKIARRYLNRFNKSNLIGCRIDLTKKMVKISRSKR
jgi:hypothetical protein